MVTGHVDTPASKVVWTAAGAVMKVGRNLEAAVRECNEMECTRGGEAEEHGRHEGGGAHEGEHQEDMELVRNGYMEELPLVTVANRSRVGGIGHNLAGGHEDDEVQSCTVVASVLE